MLNNPDLKRFNESQILKMDGIMEIFIIILANISILIEKDSANKHLFVEL